MKPAIREVQRRREIFQYISENPGSHPRDISRKMNIPFSSLHYHLKYLQKKGFIITRTDGKFNRYYIAHANGEKEKRILTCLRKKTILHMILWFFITIQCSEKDLSIYLEKHPATINYHLRKMLQAEMIKQVPITKGVVSNITPPITVSRPQVSSEKIYVLQDAWMIYDVLKKNKEKLGEPEIMTSIVDFVEYIILGGVPRQIQNREKTRDAILNTFYQFFFPPSFCS